VGKMRRWTRQVFGKRSFSKDFVYQPKYNVVIVDVETTGLSPQNDRIIEIAAIKMIDGVRVGIFSSLINPSIEIPENITKITNITQQMVDKAPNPREVLFQFSQFLGNNHFLAHNANFDSSMIMNELNRYSIPLTNCFKKQNNTSTVVTTLQDGTKNTLNHDSSILCTLKMTKRIFPGLNSYSLQNLSTFFQLNSKTFHRALDDCQVTSKIFQFLHIEMTKKLGFSPPQEIFEEISNGSSLESIVRKYKNLF
jgi:DNA polymerase III epsilon subunit family exonuclease